MFEGIDVSKYQGTINWEQVKASGIDFAMIRVGYATVEDPMFQENITNAVNAGIDCGVYLYSYAVKPEQAVAEAQFVLNAIEPYTLRYPVAFDVENKSQSLLSNEALAEVCNAFLSTVQDANYYAILYSTANWLETRLNVPLLNPYDRWVANVGVPKPSYTGEYGMWQYSWKGRVNGISVNVDLDRAYKDYSAIIQQAGLNNPDNGRDYKQMYLSLKTKYDQLTEKLSDLAGEYPPAS